MKLYTFPIAPNPTKVRLYLAEKEAAGCAIPVEMIEVHLGKGEHRAETHLARNPFGTLPVLELDDGRFVTESLAIIEYFEDLNPEPSMIGSTPDDRALARSLERTIDLGILISLGRAVHATKSPVGDPPNPPVAEAELGRAKQALTWIDGLLADGRPFVAGSHPTIADFTLAAGLQFARFGELALPGNFPNIERWDTDYRARDLVQSILIG